MRKARRKGAARQPRLITPTFGGTKNLARFIHENHRQKNGRPSPAAFYLDDEDYLSVNSLEVEKVSAIKEQYSRRGKGVAAAVIRNVNRFNLAARAGGLPISLQNGQWEYVANGAPRVAYAHHYNNTSPSHCGVHFVLHIPEEKLISYAKILADQKYHIL